MKRLIALLLLIAFVPLSASADGRQAPFRIGLFPNLSPLTLIATHQPVAKYLEKTFGQPVELMTAPDFRTFIERADAGAYDAVLAAPHLARLIEQGGRYQAVAAYDQKLRAVMIVPAESARATVADLKGATIAEPDALALVGMLARQMLASAGLKAGDVHWFYAHSHNGAALAVISGRADAAVIGSVPYALMSEAQRSNVRILATSPANPNHVWLVNRQLGEDRRRAFRAAMLGLPKTVEGRHYLKNNGYGGIHRLQEDELKSMDPFVDMVRERLDADK